MPTYTKNFKNELGNEIMIQISEKDIDGVSGVLIFIAGPKSEITAHITEEETRILHEQLGQILLKK